MKRIISYMVCILVGAGIGWYFGYTRPVGMKLDKVLENYRQVKEALKWTDKEVLEAAPHVPEMKAIMRQSDEFLATVGYAALNKIEAGDIEGAKKLLARIISIHYRTGQMDNTNLLARVAELAAKSSALSNAIYRKMDSK
ncbi:MAG: hypothetical protein HZC54_15375 [Verrucomicrobia bacterium]|nr:hypothetical protein [Verrucomicrobiota bacterium]